MPASMNISRANEDSYQTALTGAMVKITKAMEPDNWVKCPEPYFHRHFAKGKEECSHCAGTGIVIKEVTNGI